MRLFRSSFVLIGSLAIALASPVGLPGADTSLQAVFNRMDQASAKFKGLKADMRKLTHTEAPRLESLNPFSATRR
jgi:hypothetical protein